MDSVEPEDNGHDHVRHCEHTAHSEQPEQQQDSGGTGSGKRGGTVDGRQFKKKNDSRNRQKEQGRNQCGIQNTQKGKQQADCQQHGQQRMGQT